MSIETISIQTFFVYEKTRPYKGLRQDAERPFFFNFFNFFEVFLFKKVLWRCCSLHPMTKIGKNYSLLPSVVFIGTGPPAGG